MTVEDLISKLHEYPPKLKIVKSFHYGGVEYIEGVEKIKIVKDYGLGCLGGKHTELDSIYMSSQECKCEDISDICDCARFIVTDTVIKMIKPNPKLTSAYENEIGKEYYLEDVIVID